MTTKARIEARRQRNRELAAADAKHRCGRCKVVIPLRARVFVTLGDPTLYCSEACRDERPELEAQ